MKKTLLIVLLMMISAMLFAGPFGMKFGWTLRELEGAGVYAEESIQQGTATSYFVVPNNQHPLLFAYVVFIDNEYGLFKIRAISQPYLEEYQIRAVFGDLKSQLTTAYGEPVMDWDSIPDDSEWQGSENFISSILYGDRLLTAIWLPEPTENGPAMVSLGVLPINESSAFVLLEYSAENTDKIIERYNESNASIL